MRKVLSLTMLILPLVLFSQTGPAGKQLTPIAKLTEPAKLVRETPLVKDGRPVSIILHPDSDAGRQAAAAIACRRPGLDGLPAARAAGHPRRRPPDRTAILIGNVNTNPAHDASLQPDSSRRSTSSVPAKEGAWSTRCLIPSARSATPSWSGLRTTPVWSRPPIGSGGSDPPAEKREETWCCRGSSPPITAPISARDSRSPASRRPPTGSRPGCGTDRKRWTKAGTRRSPANCAKVALRYQLNGDAVEAKLYAALWDMYAKSAKDDPRNSAVPGVSTATSSPWRSWPGWRIVENDPSLTDAERLNVTRSLGRWVSEPVVTSCAEASTQRAFFTTTKPSPRWGRCSPASISPRSAPSRRGRSG